MTNQESTPIDKAINAIVNVSKDTSVSLFQTLENLDRLLEEVENQIDTVEMKIKDKTDALAKLVRQM